MLSKYIYPKINEKLFDMANDVKTPAIIYDVNHIKEVIYNFKKDLKIINCAKLYFSMKASNTVEVLKVLYSENLGIDVASVHELNEAKKIGFSKISITSPGLKYEDIDYLQKENVDIDFDSLNQLEYFAENYNSKEIGIRVSSECLTNSKSRYNRFGININSNKFKDIINNYDLKIVRLHFHIGPNDINEILEAFEFIEGLDHDFKYVNSINFGGGLSNLYQNREKTLNGFIRLNNKIEKSRLNIKEVIFEPGEALIINAGYLVTEVLSIKESEKNNKRYAITDSSPWSSAPWIKPSVINLSKLHTNCEMINYIITGNTLYDGDIYGNGNLEEIMLLVKKINIGERLVFSQFGAYTLSNHRPFHLYPKPHVYTF